MTLVLFGLAAVTGIVDAVCYLALGHVFTANMTGNVVLLGFAAAGVESLSVARSGAALGAFFMGAVMGARLASATTPVMAQRWPSAAFAVESALLLISAAVAVSSAGGAPPASTGAFVVIVLTGVAMGVRNATTRRLGERDLNTTVLTMTLTGIAADSVLAGGTNPGLLKRVGSVVSILAGAAIGACLLAYSAGLALAVAGAASSVCAAGAFLALRPARITPATTHRDADRRGNGFVTPLQVDRRNT